MDAEKRSNDIFAKFYAITCNVLDAKECSLVYVNGIIDELKALEQPAYKRACFWEDVRRIIEKK